MAESYRRNYIYSGDNFSFFVAKVFCSWDFGITDKPAAMLKQKSIFNDLQVRHLSPSVVAMALWSPTKCFSLSTRKTSIQTPFTPCHMFLVYCPHGFSVICTKPAQLQPHTFSNGCIALLPYLSPIRESVISFPVHRSAVDRDLPLPLFPL